MSEVPSPTIVTDHRIRNNTICQYDEQSERGSKANSANAIPYHEKKKKKRSKAIPVTGLGGL
jgi:hypothetical protein